MTILDELAARARVRVADAKQHMPFDLLKERVAEANANAARNTMYAACETAQAGTSGNAARTAQAATTMHAASTAHVPTNANVACTSTNVACTANETRTANVACTANAAITTHAATFPFEQALRCDGLSFICECKRASPSKGLIAPHFPYLEIARAYENAGANAISVLTEPSAFLGDARYLQEIASAVHIPCLRKDFIVDEYMIYEAKLLGAQAVLLICAILDTPTLAAFLRCCNELGLSALVEAHNKQEISQALAAGARIIGVNNRNLHDFSVSTNCATELRKYVPPEIAFVAESGIKSATNVLEAYKAGADAVLVGEALMRAEDKAAELAKLRSKLPETATGGAHDLR